LTQIDLTKYTQFVNAITSDESNDTVSFVRSIQDLQIGNLDINVALLMTAAMGMSGEAGEFSEIVKKLVFHRKPLTEELRTHLAKELGDQIWYWTNACRAIGVDPNQVIADNVTKLQSRYPGGVFSAERAENRAAGDI
jgi:NTP pyrophosphatase (non-canonical NTP hydrolase)